MPRQTARGDFLGRWRSSRFRASALGVCVWAMTFLATTILSASIVIGKKLGAIFRV